MKEPFYLTLCMAAFFSIVIEGEFYLMIFVMMNASAIFNTVITLSLSRFHRFTKFDERWHTVFAFGGVTVSRVFRRVKASLLSVLGNLILSFLRGRVRYFCIQGKAKRRSGNLDSSFQIRHISSKSDHRP